MERSIVGVSAVLGVVIGAGAVVGPFARLSKRREVQVDGVEGDDECEEEESEEDGKDEGEDAAPKPKAATPAKTSAKPRGDPVSNETDSELEAVEGLKRTSGRAPRRRRVRPRPLRRGLHLQTLILNGAERRGRGHGAGRQGEGGARVHDWGQVAHWGGVMEGPFARPSQKWEVRIDGAEGDEEGEEDEEGESEVDEEEEAREEDEEEEESEVNEEEDGEENEEEDGGDDEAAAAPKLKAAEAPAKPRDETVSEETDSELEAVEAHQDPAALADTNADIWPLRTTTRTATRARARRTSGCWPRRRRDAGSLSGRSTGSGAWTRRRRCACCRRAARLGLFKQVLAAPYQDDVVEEANIRAWHAAGLEDGPEQVLGGGCADDRAARRAEQRPERVTKCTARLCYNRLVVRLTRYAADDDADSDPRESAANQRLLRLGDDASDLDLSNAGSLSVSLSSSGSSADDEPDFSALASSLAAPSAHEVAQSLERVRGEDNAAAELKTPRKAASVPLGLGLGLFGQVLAALYQDDVVGGGHPRVARTAGESTNISLAAN
ncbi:hypothetical protein HWV62_28656 [Athelia sp. TMB]|nr:hypothetical protein HWV62_28656 [Athelia sp. TMB]